MGDRSSSCHAVGRAAVLTSALFLIAALLAPSRAHAQAGTVTGRLTDESGAPLGGATVTIAEAKLGAISQMNGDFVIVGVPAGTYTVKVQLIGYRTTSQSVTVGAGERASTDFKLVADPLKLEGVVVTGTNTPREKLESSQAV